MSGLSAIGSSPIVPLASQQDIGGTLETPEKLKDFTPVLHSTPPSGGVCLSALVGGQMHLQNIEPSLKKTETEILETVSTGTLKNPSQDEIFELLLGAPLVGFLGGGPD